MKQVRLIKNIAKQRECLFAQQDHRQPLAIYGLQIHAEAGVAQKICAAVRGYAIAPDNHMLWKNNDTRVCDVVVQIPGLFILQRGGIVNLDVKASAIDVQLLPVGRNA